MKHLLLSCLLFSFILACDDDPEPFTPVCTDFTLEKVDSTVWNYCYLFYDQVPVSCHNENDTLTLQVTKHFENIKAKVFFEGMLDSLSIYCLSMENGFNVVKTYGNQGINSLNVINLPDCFKKDGLRVLISGDLRAWPGLNELNCGEPFELTAIEEIP